MDIAISPGRAFVAPPPKIRSTSDGRPRTPPPDTAPFAPAVRKQIRTHLAAADLMPDTCLLSLPDAMWLMQVNFLRLNKAVVGHRSARYVQ